MPPRFPLALLLPALLAARLSGPASGQCAGCGATFGPVSGGPSVGPAGMPGVMSPGLTPTTLAGNEVRPADLTDWRLWWRQNQALYLALKAHVHALGTDTGGQSWFLGEGQQPQKGTLRPTVEQVRGEIAPALLAALAREKNDELVSSAMVALAKIGADGDAALGARIEAALTRHLTDGNQQVREVAAVALGILASPRAIPLLAHLLWNTEEGRKAVKGAEVDYRTRSFAAYGLGLVGARAENELDRQIVVSILRQGLESDDTSSRDLEVACLISFGLVPLATIETPPALVGPRTTPPERSRLAQLDYVRAILRDERREVLTRAQCPVTLARLLAAPEGKPEPEPELARYRDEIARDLLDRVERERDRSEILQSCVLALGQIGTNEDASPLDARIRRVLGRVPSDISEPQTRAFALVAAAEAGARPGPGPLVVGAGADGIADARGFLQEELFDGKYFLQPWAGLATGVFCWRLQADGVTDPALETLQRSLRHALEDERSQDRLGAYALGAGLAGSLESAPRMMKLFAKELPDETRGQVALGLALLGHSEAIAPLREVVANSRFRPGLLRDGAIALAILGDKDVATQLAAMLQQNRSLSTQSAITGALGFIGDRRSVEPLLQLLGDKLATERARAFAAVALGNVADKELLPWNAKIGAGLNYRAAPATLSDPRTGTGILDFL